MDPSQNITTRLPYIPEKRKGKKLSANLGRDEHVRRASGGRKRGVGRRGGREEAGFEEVGVVEERGGVRGRGSVARVELEAAPVCFGLVHCAQLRPVPGG
eukprot:3941764-Rhodomonas_salina.2